MAIFNAQKYWWVVIIAVAVIGIAAILITEQWMPGYQSVGVALAFSMIGIAFCWAYSINKMDLWWAIIPGLGVFVLLAALLADYFIGTDPENDWISVLVIGVGAATIGVILKRKDAKFVLLVVSIITVLVGIAMAPLTPTLKIILIAVDILGPGILLWRKRGSFTKTT